MRPNRDRRPAHRVEMRVFVDERARGDNSAAAACEGGFCFFLDLSNRGRQIPDMTGRQYVADEENRYGGHRSAL